MKGLFTTLAQEASFREAFSYTGQKSPFLAYGLGDSAETHFACALASEQDAPLVIITANELKARAVADDLKLFLNEEGRPDPMFFPAKDPLFYQADVRGLAIEEKRTKVFRALVEEKKPVLVMSVEAFYDRLMPRELWAGFVLRRRMGQKLAPDYAAARLVRMGYERKDLVDAPGQFSIRGGILDIFPITDDCAFRVELWDDEIDTIRLMDVETQRSVKRVDEIVVYPAAEIMIDEARALEGAAKIKAETEKVARAFDKEGKQEECELIKEISERMLDRLKDQNFRGLEGYVPLFYPDSVTIADYLPEDAILAFQDPARIADKMRVLETELSDSITHRMEKGYLLTSQGNMYPARDEIERGMERFARVYTCNLLAGNQSAFPVKHILDMQTRSVLGIQTSESDLLEQLRADISLKYRVLLFCESSLQVKRLVNRLNEEGISAYEWEKTAEAPHPGAVAVAFGKLSQGFSYPGAKLSLIPLKETGAGKKTGRKRRKFTGTKFDSFTDLKVGDYIVHENHGVGIYQGIVQMGPDDHRRDYFKIIYKDGGCLYVPTTSLDLLQKYAGGEEATPKLNRLGGIEWQRTKTRVKESVAALAEDLVALYAARKARPGFMFSPDTVWQTEFEELFPYDETADQLAAIEDTKRDMESSSIMDRLICGDVGYGKTEIAIRAAFKAVQDGKQVAMLAPTTILAQQHYNTFTARMRDYPIRVELLSRFRSPKEMKAAIADTAKGAVDILIGTHRLLSDDVKFKDLGLLVVDEEQRFGVGHKEKMKSMKEEVDVLTLTATPIPRTLHMSLTGIRDMSLLEEAPQDRQPIQTYVMEEDEALVREAIYREISRSGQVFYLHNRVHNIEETAARVQKLVPEARVAFAHGQMSERELENVMMAFVQGEVDVLVCTTIVETGLDISNVNTILIEDADSMGLAQLYQLRGRVGRSARMAYAYFLYHKGKVLSEVAAKRLEAIGEFTEFGSGYKIAKRDLEIRGAGNVLGPEQHGHMGAVGYDLYCKLLEEAMNTLQDKPVHEDFETEVHMEVNAFIPGDYIPNEGQRLQIYRKIAAIRSEEDYFDMQDELLDRYADMPKCVANLLDIAYIKSMGQMIEVEKIEYGEAGPTDRIVRGRNKEYVLSLTFRNGAQPDLERLNAYLDARTGLTRVAVGGGKTRILVHIDHDERDEVLLSKIKEEMKEISKIGGQNA